MLRKSTLVLAAAVGLLAVTASGAGAEPASESPYDFVLASYTIGGCSVFITAWRAGEGGRTFGAMRHECISDRKMPVCIDVEGNEAYLEFEGPHRLVWNLFLADNRATGEPDAVNSFGAPVQGDVSGVCPEFDSFGRDLARYPVVGDINIHDG